MPGLGEQPGESLAQERFVLGDHDAHGISATQPDPTRRRLPDRQNAVRGADAIAQVHDQSAMIDWGVDGERKEPARSHGLDPDRPSRGFDNVADDGIRRLPNGRVEWVDVDRPDRHGHRRTLGQAFDRGRKALIGKNARVDTVGHIAQLIDRERQLPGRLPDEGYDRFDIPVPSPMTSRSPIAIAMNRC